MMTRRHPVPARRAVSPRARRGYLVTALLLLATIGTTASAYSLSRTARITKDGLGRIEIGMTVSQVRTANGGVLGEPSNAAGDGSCASATIGTKVYGLFTNGILARIYVDTSRYSTRKGIHVGDRAADVRRAYGRNVRSSPAPYDPSGRILTVTTGNRKVTFTTRSTGRIISISTGRSPEIDYIEGCA